MRTTKTGKVSGKTVTEDTTPAVNEEYKIYTANTGDDKVIALTFDDGPWKDTTAEILDVLKENDAHATFFTIGKQIADHSDVVKRAHDEGHEICTHTWDHAAGSGQGVNLTYMTADEQIQEVQKGFQAIKDVIGEDPVRIMRAPGGNFKGDIVWTLQPYIDAEIGWNVDTEDWRRPGHHREPHHESEAGKRHPHARRRRRPLADRRGTEESPSPAEAGGLPLRHDKRASAIRPARGFEREQVASRGIAKRHGLWLPEQQATRKRRLERRDTKAAIWENFQMAAFFI